MHRTRFIGAGLMVVGFLITWVSTKDEFRHLRQAASEGEMQYLCSVCGIEERRFGCWDC